MSYNVRDLAVVEDGSHKFICQKTLMPSVYTEVFTGKIIKVKDKKMIVPLSTYYRILPFYLDEDYIISKTTISKEELLCKYLDLNEGLDDKKKDSNDSKKTVENEKYKMKDYYMSKRLIVAKLKIPRKDSLARSYICLDENYIFEVMPVYDNDNDEGKVKFREVFTGFIADVERDDYLNAGPCIVDWYPLTAVLPSVDEKISKLELLWIQNDINHEVVIADDKKNNSRIKVKHE